MPAKPLLTGAPPPWRDGRLGAHLLLELWDCTSLPDDEAALERFMVHAAELAGATVVATSFHAFSPYGLSGVVVLAESHLAIHTWPERRAACIDLFSCNPAVSTDSVVRFLADAFGADRYDDRLVSRGVQQAEGSTFGQEAEGADRE